MLPQTILFLYLLSSYFHSLLTLRTSRLWDVDISEMLGAWKPIQIYSNSL